MDQIAQHLKAEIESLQEYIQRTEERLQVSAWVSELLDPFERAERNFTDSELRKTLYALYHAKHRFSVNGHLSTRIDSILSRHQDLLPDLLEEPSPADASSDHLPARDPSIYSSEETDERAEEDDEEIQDSPSPADADETIVESRSSTEEKFVDPPADDLSQLFDEEEDDGLPTKGFADKLFQPSSSSEDKEDTPEATEVDAVNQKNGNFVPKSDLQAVEQASIDRLKLSPKERISSLRNRVPQPETEEAQIVDIFLEKVELDDLLLRLDISIPLDDKTRLESLLRNKMADRVIPALQANPLFEKQYILIPRISRFTYDGVIYPCTIKNLARTFIALFGDIKDLMQYKTHSFLDSEVPEPGWALITPEAPAKSLSKNYMEQQQYLRYLATTIGLPSHLVRRRRLVEAVYDLIVGRMVLGTPLQNCTLDWTSTGTSKTDFVCVYSAEKGIRLRDLPRTTHNQALGVCPNW